MIQLINIKDEEQWLQYRNNAIGGSEISTLLNMNPYKSKMELFFDKIGFTTPKPFYNLRAAYGTCTESLNSDLVATYNATKPEDHAMNLKKGIKFREVNKLPHLSYVVNSEYPNLIVSPDREVIINGISGSLECKDSGSMVVNAYKNRIVTAHEIQLKVQLAAWDKAFGILSYILDAGREYKEHYYERNYIILNDEKTGKVITENDLKDEIFNFWQSVILGRELSHKIMVAKQQFQYDKAAAFEQMLDGITPEPDFLLAYESYMKESYYTFAKPKIERNGTDEDEQAAENFLKTKEQMKLAEEKHQKERNNILRICKKGEKILLPGKGYIECAITKVGVSIKVKN